MIIDAHSDLLTELAHRHLEERPFARRWLPSLRRGGVRVQVCALFASWETLPEKVLRRALDEVSALFRAVRETDAIQINTREDLDHVVDHTERVGLLLSMEGLEPLGADTRMAEIFWQLGVRMFSLTHNRTNVFADGAADPSPTGLTRLGREVVSELGSLGALIDLAHASEPTYWNVLAQIDPGSVLISHAGCRAVHNTPRNVTDDQLRALAEHNGVFCVMALPPAIGPDESGDYTLDRVVDHLLHAVDVMGERHVGIGADFAKQLEASGAIPSSFEPLLHSPDVDLSEPIRDFGGPEDFGALSAVLTSRGVPEALQNALKSGNLLQLFRNRLPAQPAAATARLPSATETR